MSWRIAASTIGKPVRPSHHTAVVLAIGPHDVGIFRLEWLVHADIGPVDQDVLVKVAPSDLADPGLDALVAAVELLGLVPVPGRPDTGPRAEGPARQMHRQTRGSVAGRDVSLVVVAADFLLAELFEAGLGRVLAAWPEGAEPLALVLAESFAFGRLRDAAIEQLLKPGPGALGVLGRRVQEFQEVEVLVDVGNPGAVPGGVDGVRPPGSAAQPARRHDAAVVDDLERLAVLRQVAHHESLPPQLVDFVLHVGVEVPATPFLHELEDAVGDLAPLVDGLDVERDVEAGQVLLEDLERPQNKVDADRRHEMGLQFLWADNIQAYQGHGGLAGPFGGERQCPVVGKTEVRLEPVDDGVLGLGLAAVAGRGISSPL